MWNYLYPRRVRAANAGMVEVPSEAEIRERDTLLDAGDREREEAEANADGGEPETPYSDMTTEQIYKTLREGWTGEAE